MSFVAPTTNIVAITSGAQTIASGSVTITLNVKNSANFTSNNFTMDVIDLGAIEVDFNYVEGAGDIDDFTINVPTFEFEMLDSIRSANNEVEQFVDIVSSLSPVDLIVAQLTFNSKSDYYYTTRDQCEFSYIDRKVKLNFKHPLKYGAIGYGKSWSNSTFTSMTEDIVDSNDVDPVGNAISAVYARDLIESYLTEISDSSNLNYYSEIYTSNSSSTVTFGQKEIMIPLVIAGNFSNATISVKQAALSESAIIGNILGDAFYVPRYRKDSGVTLDIHDFEELDMDYSFKNVRYFNFEYEFGDPAAYTSGTATPNVSTDGQVLINNYGNADVNVDYEFLTSLYPCEADFYSGVPYLSFGSSYYSTVNASFESNVISSYKDIFRISNSSSDAGVTISGTILGIDKLKPYQYFSVGSGVHPLVDNKDFRPSYLKYNLLDDTIEFEAYEF
jgi:hypothetical protein